MSGSYRRGKTLENRLRTMCAQYNETQGAIFQKPPTGEAPTQRKKYEHLQDAADQRLLFIWV